MRRKRVLVCCDVCGDRAVGRNFGAITCVSCKALIRTKGSQELKEICDDNTETAISVRDSESPVSDTGLNTPNDDTNQMLLNFLCKPVFIQMVNTSDFNDMESWRLSELFRSSHVFSHQPFYETSIFEITDLNELNRICNMDMDKDIQKVIKFAKTLDSFNNLCLNDQLALIKYGGLELLILRYTILFDTDTDYWTHIWLFECCSDGKCAINMITRKVCKRCRLDKCFRNNMKIELIQSKECTKYEVKRRLKTTYREKRSSLTSTTPQHIIENDLFNKILESDETIDETILKEILDIGSFNRICANDQLALIKYGCIELLILRYSMHYSPGNECWAGGLLFECCSDGKCAINMMTRKACKRCRLEKCFLKGMKTELVKSKECKKYEVKRLLKTRYSGKRSSLTSTTPQHIIENDLFNKILESDETIDETILKDILDISISSGDESSNISADTQLSIETYLTFNSESSDTFDTDLYKRQTYCQPVFTHITNCKSFNDIESRYLSELFSAASALGQLYYLGSNMLEITNIDELYRLCGPKMDSDITNLITFTKNLGSFDRICANDQLALFKYGCIELLILRYSMHYNPRTERWAGGLEFIQNKEQKELRKQTIEENKRKRNEKQRKRSDSKSSSATTDSTDSQSLSVDTVFNSNRNVQREVLTLNQCIRTHMTDQAMDVNQNFLLYLFTPLMRPINTYSDWNEIECKHLSDMCLASNVFRYPTTERHYEVYTIGDYYREWGNRLEVDAKNIVKYTKEMTKYCNVNQEDKLILIKYACMELIILRANYCWDSQAEKWTIFMDNDTSFIVPLDLLKSEKRNLFNTYKVYFNKILPEWNWDSVILDLLTAIVLFNPNRPNLSDRFTVKFQQQMYIHLLQRYLMLRFRWEWQWKAKMANLMNALIDLHLVSEIEIQNGEFIQSAKQKELRKIAIEDNKKIGKNDRKAAIDGNKSVTDKTPSNGEIGSKDDVFAKIFDNNKRVYNDVIALNRCIVENLDNRPPKLDQNQKQLFQHLFAPLLQPINVYKDWTDGEHQWVSDLCLTSNVFEEKYTEKCIEVQNIHHFYELWGNRIENDTKNIVTFTKGLTQGTDICHNDQIALVKYSSMELIVLRANHFYDDRAQTWTCNVNNEYSFITPMNVLKLEKRDLYNSYKVYLDKILPEWNRDTVILNLLSAIVLFNPERPNMINPKAVKAKRDMYLYLLQRYLMIKYRWEWQWRAKMSSLMNALNDLQHVSQIEIQNGIEEKVVVPDCEVCGEKGVALNKSMKDITKDGGRHPMDINQRLTQYLTAPLLRPINTYNDLNEIECKHLLDLCLATDVFSVPSAPHNYIHVNNIHEFYTNWGNRIETDTHCVVSIIKALTKNVDICHNDQIALVKYSSMEISVLRANYDYDLQTEKWTLFIQDPCNLCVFPLDVLKDEKRNLYGVYKSHLNKIIPEWNWDRVLVDLLTVIILFNPNRPNIINSDIVKFRQQLYIYLLQRYLSMKYKWEWLWNYKMSNLMNALVDLNVVSRIEILNDTEDLQQIYSKTTPTMASIADTNGTEEVVVKKQRRIYPKNSFDRFGDDLCGLILSHLSLDKRLDYECVSKQFQRTVFKSVVDITIHDKESKISRITVSNTGLLATIHGKCPHIHTIDCRGIRSRRLTQTAEVLDIFRPNLRNIYCNYDRNVYQRLPAIGSLVTRIGKISEKRKQRLRLCRRLSRLRVQRLSDVFDDKSGRLLATNLHSFEVPFNSTDNNQLLSPFVAANQSLRSFKMIGENDCNYNGSHESIVEMAAQLSRLPQLKELSLKLMPIYGHNSLNECLHTIGQKCPQLQCFALSLLSNKSPLNGHTLDSLQSYRRLKRFDLTLIGFELAIDGTLLDPLKHCHRLTHLSFSLRLSTVQVVHLLDNHWPRLHTYINRIITSNGLYQISRLPALQTLVFVCYQYIGPNDYLNADGNRFASDVCEHLFSRSPKLKTIGMLLFEDFVSVKTV
ncbi:unnamed protein product [Medioppia subpectinata]|uniref:NR LBD domain-containing protein n=1 Tax=Medioppia subpectinata TaxID=1979941 RepID=A0A7R9KAN4_9ACAR|nr:unnamed protein product [Medioppia subpectinata]CAG2099982.1 unnamed protein product [Medioppia subpectinata]